MRNWKNLHDVSEAIRRLHDINQVLKTITEEYIIFKNGFIYMVDKNRIVERFALLEDYLLLLFINTGMCGYVIKSDLLFDIIKNNKIKDLDAKQTEDGSSLVISGEKTAVAFPLAEYHVTKNWYNDRMHTMVSLGMMVPDSRHDDPLIHPKYVNDNWKRADTGDLIEGIKSTVLNVYHDNDYSYTPLYITKELFTGRLKKAELSYRFVDFFRYEALNQYGIYVLFKESGTTKGLFVFTLVCALDMYKSNVGAHITEVSGV